VNTWTSDELNKIGNAEELQIASLRCDGTLRNPVTIWVVRVDDNLYIRAVKGRTGPWFRGTQTRHAGCIHSGGVEKDVLFMDETNPDINKRIDAAYQEKYSHYPKDYVDACLTPLARAATLELVPRSTDS
jgi:hypothetical protein